MIVAPMTPPDGTRADAPPSVLRLVTQNDHAHLSAAILRLWRHDGLPANPRRRIILRAAREHDNGWRESDAAPRVDPASGRPRDFRSMTDDDRRTIWARGVDRHRADEPEVTALVLAHARRLHRDREDNDAWRPLMDRWRALDDELASRRAEDPSNDPEAFAADYRLVDLADTLSLALADRWREDFDFRGVRCAPRPAADADTLAIAPFPLAGATTFDLPCRLIPDRRYASDTDLALTLAEARWVEHRVRLMPLD